jgi:hypothetical protein
MQKKDGKQGKNLKIQKLVLSKETLRSLTDEELRFALGARPGDTATDWCTLGNPTGATCNSTTAGTTKC